MADLSIFKLDNQTITIKDTTARQTAESAKTLATTASDNATTALNKVNEQFTELKNDLSNIGSRAIPSKSASGSVVTFADGADGAKVKSLVLNLEPHQSGTGDPSPSNIRPISGWTGATVRRAGKNLLPFGDIFEEGWTNTLNGITATYSNGHMKITGTSTSSDWTNIVPYRGIWERNPYQLGAGTYIMSDYVSITASIDGGSYANKTVGFTAQESVLVKGFYISVATNQTVDWDIPLMFVYGSTRPTTYEPYTTSTYPIAFPSEAGTVYGGTLDVTTGALTVDRVMEEKTIASMNNSEDFPGWQNQRWIDNLAMGDTSSRTPAGTMMNISGFHVNMIGVNRLSHVLFLPVQMYGLRQTQWKADYPDLTVQICYPLATPITYQLAPIEVTTLLGDNTIWMDAEGTIDATYRVDTKMYVDNRIKSTQGIIAPVENSYTATANYAIGDYLIVEDTLYKVTAAIASGGTITPDTNVTATTVMAQIKALA